MLSWALAFFIVAIIAAVFGFFGFAGAASGVAQLLAWIFLLGFVISLGMGLTAKGKKGG